MAAASAETVASGASLAEVAGNAAVLVVDDEPGMRNFLGKALERHCALVELADSVESAEQLRRRYLFDLLIVDNRLPGRTGVEWVTELRDKGSTADVIVMTAYAELDTAIAALRAYAADFLLKPFRLEQMTGAVARCLQRRRMARENFLLRRELRRPGLGGIVGESDAIREVCDLVTRVAPSPSTLLIEGETGTGKELVARAVHELSGRRGAFVPVNCSAIAPELFESELFGHAKGAFTGAHSSREGLFSYAHGGTLFLDEIGEMPRAMQAELLRTLEHKTIRPVGADRETPIDVRVIAATNRRLANEVAAGRFRADLYYRLNVVAVSVPSLRQRRLDIPDLAEHFSRTLSEELGVAPIPFSSEDLRCLQDYAWPGNVRELKNVIERSLLLGRLPADCGVGAPGLGSEPSLSEWPIEWSLEEMEKRHMLEVLEAHGGNKSSAARALGVSRKTLERKLKAWGLSAAEEEAG